MTTQVIRSELDAPIERIAGRVDAAIEEMRSLGDSRAWKDAVDAVLAISRAPKHLVRAQLVLLGSLAGSGPTEGERVERFAAGVELLHLFMLVHDDVMDNANLRRGRPTLRVAIQASDPTIQWTEARDLAVVMGNMLNVLAMRALLPQGGPGEAAACEIMLDACCRAGAGQFHDLLGYQRLGADLGALRRELIDKSAYQAFAAPFAAGLRLARPDADLAPALAWGCALGLAFQTLDDLTDLVAPPAVTGKDGLRDLLEGRPSLPILLLHERTSGDDRELLESIAGKKTMIPTHGERARIDDMMRRCEIVAGCAAWVRTEIAAAARTSREAGFTDAGREGMAAVEARLLSHLDEVVREAARDHDA